MGALRKNVITPAEFESASRELQVTISAVARATGIPRQYLSGFVSKTRPTALTPDQQQALRDYFLSEGVEFATSQSQGLASSVGVVIQEVNAPCLMVSRSLSQADFTAITDRLAAIGSQVSVILATKLKTGLFGGPSVDAHDDQFRELFALMAEGYMLYVLLTRTNPVKAIDPDADPVTLHDILSKAFGESILAELARRESDEPFPERNDDDDDDPDAPLPESVPARDPAAKVPA